MQYVDQQWRHDLEAFLRKDVDAEVFKFSDAVIILGPVYNGHRQRGMVVQGDDRPLRGRRRGKCWRCTERHVPRHFECPRTIDDLGMVKGDEEGRQMQEQETKEELVPGNEGGVCRLSLLVGGGVRCQELVRTRRHI